MVETPPAALEDDGGGFLLAAFSAGMWTATPAWLAFQGGYMDQAYIYAGATLCGLVIGAVGGHIMGIRMERDL